MPDKPTYEELEQRVKELEQDRKEHQTLQLKLANAMEIANLAQWEYDVASDLFTFNDQFYRMFRTTAGGVGGYTISYAEYARRFIHPEDVHLVTKEAEKLSGSYRSSELEHRIIYADGTVGHIMVRSFIVKDDQGRTVKTYGVNQDITQRKQIETRLQGRIEFEQIISRISSELARSGGKGIDMAINSALDKVGKFTGADRAYVFWFREDLVQMDNTHEWCAEGIEPQIDYLKGITLDDELPWFSARIRDREIFHVSDITSLPPEARLEREHFEGQGIQSLIVVPIKTANRLNGFLGFDAVRTRRAWGEDEQNILRFLGETIGHVMVRKKVEKALGESDARWHFALEGAGDGVWDWNAVTDRAYFSTRWKTMLGYKEEEIGDTLNEWDSRVHPDDKEATYAEIKRHFNGEAPVYQSEHRVRCKDGSYKWILDRGKVIQWTEDGKPMRMIGTHTDISDAKLLQEKHEKLIDELQKAMSKVKQLSGMLPICSYCKKIRDDKGYWKQIETYIQDHSEAEFSHSICRECAERHYPEFFKSDE